MKIFAIYPLVIALMLNIEISGQNNISDFVADNSTELSGIKTEANKTIDFTMFYNINIVNVKKAKILRDAEAYITPLLNSPEPEFKIPQGSVVEIYKYFPKDASQAIKCDNQWCFVSSALIVPLQEKVQESSVLLYDEAPKILSTIQINYPEEAKKNGITGKVLLKILVSKTGFVDQVVVIKSIPGLDKAALEAVKKLKFKPGKYQGKPVDTWIKLPINFEIER